MPTKTRPFIERYRRMQGVGGKEKKPMAIPYDKVDSRIRLARTNAIHALDAKCENAIETDFKDGGKVAVLIDGIQQDIVDEVAALYRNLGWNVEQSVKFHEGAKLIFSKGYPNQDLDINLSR